MSIAEIAWRGPRPLQDGDPLLGRRRELRELVDRCETYDVVRITARSGVGKTSFVAAGGVRALETAGYFVPPIQRWPQMLGDQRIRALDSAEEIARALYALAIGATPAPEESSMVATVESIADGRPMAVILDQLEELLRYQPAIGAALLRISGETARDSRVPQIVIARSEYSEQLEPVEVRGVHVWNLRLVEIEGEKTLSRIVAEPVELAGGSIGDDEVAQIVGWWTSARTEALLSQAGAAALTGGVGLLHMQSLLWSFRHWGMQNEVSKHITASDLNDFVAARAGARGFDARESDVLGRHLISDAVTGYVDDTVARLTANPTVERDGEKRALTWRNGPRLMLARIAPALSSGGYKVPQARSSLIPLGLGAELTQRSARILADLVRSGADLTRFATHSRLEGAGLAADWDKPQLLGEMLAALESVLASLSSEEANLLRAFNVAEEPVYELVHDGIGPALTQWSQEFSERPVSAISVITAEPGGAIWHSLTPATFTDRDDLWDAVELEGEGAGATVIIRGLRWQSNYIGPTGDARLKFEGLVVRDGDFTGAAFVGCDFSRIRFEDCKFTGTALIDCRFADVHFLPSSETGDKLDLLTFVACSAAAEGVVLDQLNKTTGLFLQGLKGGSWKFTGGDFSHLVASAAEPTQLTFKDAEIRHVTIEGAIELTQDGGNLHYAEVVD